MNLPALDPLIVVAVIVSTAVTDAAYVMFNAAVSERRRLAAANWSGIWYAGVGLHGHQLHVEPGFTHKGLRSYAWGGFGDVRAPDPLAEPAKDGTSAQTAGLFSA